MGVVKQKINPKNGLLVRRHWWLNGLEVRSLLCLEVQRIGNASSKPRVLEPGGTLNLVKGRNKSKMSHLALVQEGVRLLWAIHTHKFPGRH